MVEISCDTSIMGSAVEIRLHAQNYSREFLLSMTAPEHPGCPSLCDGLASAHCSLDEPISLFG
jgi:hypothetical protein